MSNPSTSLIQAQNLTYGPIRNLTFSWPAGVSWVCGDEGKGKTTLLRLLAGHVQPDVGTVTLPSGGVFWVDLQSPTHDAITVQACWDDLRTQYPQWNDEVLNDLAEAMDMHPHREKQLHMLSAGSRRKVMVVAALASGAAVTLLDQPFAALDLRSVQITQEFLSEAAEHPHRAWIVADYEPPGDLPLACVLNLDMSRH